ncbi:tyrosine-type recombinase/integrase [Aurantimonas coralicida]|uniref:tyrosine-type recombinase/integrase n=1 Tax=Aurantimonas coralicida TaxID=182270 RepID=UPI001E3A88BA|nr:site-specific integrase [Aurantimonas coralicida]MCD1644797.1 integrase arm-type DNA-binding domain-containing protein [Aurantimonas coralicida]
MARALHRLTDTAAKSDRLKPGRHADGGGLYLNVSKTGAKSWLFMWAVGGGKRREMGLGSYPAVSLAKARKTALSYREAVTEGRDPIAEREKVAEPTFGECADLFLASMSSSWRNEKHRAQWQMTLTVYCEAIRAKRVSAVDTNDVLKVLTPIWAEKPETASRLRGRIERVLDFAKARGWRSGENPALWRGHLRNILPARQKLTRGHHAAMPFVDVPAFVAWLRESGAMAARALEFTILTAARSGETRGASWSEIDFGKAQWVIPANRMKASREHRVPLSGRAVEILRELHELRAGDLIFPGQKRGKPLSVMAMDMLLRRMKVDVTVHGFRSSFRDWCAEETSFPREVAEQALAHVVGDATERAYRRGDALEKRRKLMEAWEVFLGSGSCAQVFHIAGKRPIVASSTRL